MIKHWHPRGAFSFVQKRTTVRKDGLNVMCAEPKVKNEAKNRMTPADVVGELCGIMVDISKDTRIPIPVRIEYMDRVEKILERYYSGRQ